MNRIVNFYFKLSMNKELLESIARQLVAPGKGILAADESTGTITKRFAKINVESTEDNRRAYRELLFTTSGIEEFISGVILFDETIKQRANDGHTFVSVLEKKGILPGIKVDLGTEPMSESLLELVTKGLEGLDERLKQYAGFAAKFAKWLAVITIGEGIPTELCIEKNAEQLAQYALLCQQNNIVPIVDPEVLMDGGHTIERCYEVTSQVLKTVFAKLNEAGVYLPGILLKPNMVIAGSESIKSSAEEIARLTLQCLHENVSAQVPGIVFLSGGQSEVEATANLQAINAMKGDTSAQDNTPWVLSFSYGRALQTSVLKTWGGKSENITAAQAEFYKRAKMNGLASKGEYFGE